MHMKRINIITAILSMAVMFIGLMSSGCVTSRHIDELKSEIRDIKADNQENRDLFVRMDSIINASIESNNKLRNDVSYSSDQTQEQISQLLENYNELLAILQQINQTLSTKQVIRSSPGVQSPPTTMTQTPVTTPTQPPSVDCVEAYDIAFTHTLREEFNEAIEKFQQFLVDCPEHENVENAHYWIGESYYLLNKYVEASEEFQFFIDNYKSSTNYSRALYQLARCKQELGKFDDAKMLYKKIVSDFPDTFDAKQAAERLKDIK